MTKKNDLTKKIVATYDYKDEAGKLLFQVVRYKGKDFRQRRPDGKGGWMSNLNGVRRVPYRLPELLQASKQDWIYIVEGEKDADRLCGIGFVATTCPMGAGKWRTVYNKHFQTRLVAILPDNDTAGKKHVEQVANSLCGTAAEIRIVELPGLPDKGDISDWLDNGGTQAELIRLTDEAKPFTPLLEDAEEPIDVSQFGPMTVEELAKILGLTIKADETNKILVFLCQLSAYTASSQFNISFNAPSSTGKSYIPTEIARLFPQEDVIEIGYCSPTAFFHDVGRYIKEREGYIVDLSRKILIFLDQPHTQLLERLRPILSHDKKEIKLKITDKTQKFGLKTKNILLRGFPAVIFCTAGLKIDEQEATRFLLLSPETSQEKIRDAVCEKIRKETDGEAYQRWLDEDPERSLLKERIRAVRQENIREVKIGQPKKIESRFLKGHNILKPRHSRDIGRLISLVKAFALLNLWFRQRDGSTIVANEDDIEAAFRLWDAISESQELNLPPYVYRLYEEVILPAYEEKNEGRADGFKDATGALGLTRQDIFQKHYRVYGRPVADWQLRQQILPMLETAGLITQEKDANDKRKLLVYPTTQLTISDPTSERNLRTEQADVLETIVSGGVG